MKTIRNLALMLLTTATVFTVKADNEKPISFDQLPKSAQEFILTHFDGKDISYAKMDRDIFDKSYEVFFTDGTKIDFDGKGEWDNVDCYRGEVPAGIVPVPISDFVGRNHPGRFIVKIDRDRKDYEIELDNEFEIKFDLNFNVIEYDN